MDKNWEVPPEAFDLTRISSYHLFEAIARLLGREFMLETGLLGSIDLSALRVEQQVEILARAVVTLAARIDPAFEAMVVDMRSYSCPPNCRRPIARYGYRNGLARGFGR